MVNENDTGIFRILSIDAARRRIRLTPVEIYAPEDEDYESPEVEGELAAVAESPEAAIAEESDDTNMAGAAASDDTDVEGAEASDDADAAIATESDDVNARIEAGRETTSGS